jgi:2'-5' RNA ligase
MEQIRSFIAIDLPEELKRGLTDIKLQLQSASRAPVKWVDPQSIHLTLKFLGNIDVSITGKVTEAIEEAVRGVHPCHLGAGGLGVFPSMKRVQVVWVGLSGEVDRLSHLQQRIESGLAPLGFARERRPFTPHLTLARIRDRATQNERQELGELVAGTSFRTDCHIKVDTVHLMKSQLTREGPIYSRISSVTLK